MAMLKDLEEVEEAYRFLQLKYEEALTQRDESLKVRFFSLCSKCFRTVSEM